MLSASEKEKARWGFIRSGWGRKGGREIDLGSKGEGNCGEDRGGEKNRGGMRKKELWRG